MSGPQVVSVDWGDVVTTTLENRSKTIADNITNNNALLSYITKRGRAKPVDGGREIYENIRYAQNQSFMWYSGTEYLSIALNDSMTAARFPWKQCSVAVVLSGLEDIINAGEEQHMDLIDERVDTAESTFDNEMSAGIYSDGTGFGGKQIGGTSLLISKAPASGIVGGLDRGSLPWWRNVAVNANTDTRGLVTSSNIQSYMSSTVLGIKRNTDGVDLIVADTNYYGAYWNSLVAIQRVTQQGGKAGVGFTSLVFNAAGKEIDVILDGGKNGQIATNTMLFLNTDFIKYRPSSRRNFKVIGGDRANVNQDAIVRIMAWAGNMTASNLSQQAVLWQ
jgi:hypothetical protein